MNLSTRARLALHVLRGRPAAVGLDFGDVQLVGPSGARVVECRIVKPAAVVELGRGVLGGPAVTAPDVTVRGANCTGRQVPAANDPA